MTEPFCFQEKISKSESFAVFLFLGKGNGLGSSREELVFRSECDTIIPLSFTAKQRATIHLEFCHSPKTQRKKSSNHIFSQKIVLIQFPEKKGQEQKENSEEPMNHKGIFVDRCRQREGFLVTLKP